MINFYVLEKWRKFQFPPPKFRCDVVLNCPRNHVQNLTVFASNLFGLWCTTVDTKIFNIERGVNRGVNRKDYRFLWCATYCYYYMYWHWYWNYNAYQTLLIALIEGLVKKWTKVEQPNSWDRRDCNKATSIPAGTAISMGRRQPMKIKHKQIAAALSLSKTRRSANFS